MGIILVVVHPNVKNMGGGEMPYKIPDYKIYKIDGIKELEWTRDKLAEKGLKDPWLRNEVWRYQRWPGWLKAFKITFKRGFYPGLALAAACVVLDKTVLGWSKHHDNHD